MKTPDPIADGRKMRVVVVKNLPGATGIPDSDQLRDLHHRGWTLFDRILEEDRKTREANTLLYVMAPPPNPDFAGPAPTPDQPMIEAATGFDPFRTMVLVQLVAIPVGLALGCMALVSALAIAAALAY